MDREPRLARGFSVEFGWIGTGVPGPQPFDLFDADLNTLASGDTINVPAMGPATLTLVVKVPLGFADVNTGNNKVTIAIQVLP